MLLISFSDVHATESTGKKAKANRLINSSSPYLRQHAHNPVDWYPWGKEALEKAKKENKPIFLSVGYSTCHWCHVMAKESYDDKEVASLINKYFVPIKVDRERRPDVDETYMLATELIAQRGGWPNNVFLTPDLKPFYGGTYFPRKDFLEVIRAIAEQWLVSQPNLLSQAERFSYMINQIMTRRMEANEVTPAVLDTAVNEIIRNYDHVNGGFSLSPKFPQEAVLLFLIHMAKQDNNEKALKAVTGTLKGLLNGGIHDHIGGGFHRYAVDAAWEIPHFEKMLYNQAFMSLALLEIYELTGKPSYSQIAIKTLKAVQREFTAPHGGFYSAFDADSEGKEGTFYIWDKKQLQELLPEKDAAWFISRFNVTDKGNFDGKNVLHISKKAIADDQAHRDKFHKIRSILLKNRNNRPKPHRDNKTVTAWNGMMIRSFAKAAAMLNDKSFKESAIKAADFIWSNMRKQDGTLYRAWFEGKPSLEATLDDYAHTSLAFIELYDLTDDIKWLKRTEELAAKIQELFYDKEAGDYYRTASTRTFTRGKSRQDGPTPSGNAVTLELFTKLSRRTHTPEYRARAEAIIASLSGIATRTPLSNASTLRSADMLHRGAPANTVYLAQGTVKASARIDQKNNQAIVSLKITPGWHINANKTLEDFLIPTTLKISDKKTGIKVKYPKPLIKKLGFNQKELALYEGNIILKLPLPDKKKTQLGNTKLELHLQACSDQICLSPETAFLLPLK